MNIQKEMKMRPQAVSKNAVLSQMSVEVEKALATAIPAINAKLVNFNNGDSVTIHVSQLRLGNFSLDVLKRVVEEIKKDYGAQGWKVGFTYGDQCDNDDWFTFS